MLEFVELYSIWILNFNRNFFFFFLGKLISSLRAIYSFLNSVRRFNFWENRKKQKTQMHCKERIKKKKNKKMTSWMDLMGRIMLQERAQSIKCWWCKAFLHAQDESRWNMSNFLLFYSFKCCILVVLHCVLCLVMHILVICIVISFLE